MRQVDAAALDVVDQPAGCRDEHVDAALELAILRRIRRAAEHADRAQPQVLSIARRLRRHLLRELARRRQHQHAGDADTAPLGRRPRALRGKPLQRGQDECRRLAGAGLRGRDDVASGEQHRNRLRLDRRRFGIAAFGERLQQRRHQVQVFESHEFPISGHTRAQMAAHTRGARRAYVRSAISQVRAAELKTRAMPRRRKCATRDCNTRKQPLPGRRHCKAIVANRKRRHRRATAAGTPEGRPKIRSR